MASLMKLSYQRLQKAPLEDEPTLNQEEIVVIKPTRTKRFNGKWFSRNGGTGRRWRRPRIKLRISSLRMVLRKRVKGVGTAFRVSVKKVVTRFKEGKPYLADLFAGNYMFMQVVPSPTPLEKSFASTKFNYAPKFTT